MRSHIVELNFTLDNESYSYTQVGPTNFNLQRINVSSSTEDALTVAVFDPTLGVLLLTSDVTPLADSAQQVVVLSQEMTVPGNAYAGVVSASDITAYVGVRLIGQAG